VLDEAARGGQTWGCCCGGPKREEVEQRPVLGQPGSDHAATSRVRRCMESKEEGGGTAAVEWLRQRFTLHDRGAGAVQLPEGTEMVMRATNSRWWDADSSDRDGPGCAFAGAKEAKPSGPRLDKDSGRRV